MATVRVKNIIQENCLLQAELKEAKNKINNLEKEITELRKVKTICTASPRKKRQEDVDAKRMG